MPDGTNQIQNEIRNSIRYSSVVEFELDPLLVITHLNKLISNDNQAEWSNSLKYDNFTPSRDNGGKLAECGCP
jgi:hypothetical protein